MFFKTLISLLSVFTIVVGFVVYVQSGDFAIFAIGMIAYLAITILGNFTIPSNPTNGEKT
jgi:hypothetical protein